MDFPPDGGLPPGPGGDGGYADDGMVPAGDEQQQQQQQYVDDGQGGGAPMLDEDEDEDVDVGAVIRDFGSHDLMKNVQKALFEQLEREHERTTVELRESENELGMKKAEKEEIGVELYGNQQQLARMQMALENLHNQYHSIAETRVTEEGVLEECKARHASLKATYTEKQKALLKAQAELDTLNETMMQVERYNEEMKNEIAITRRATYKAETSVQDLEKQKQGQDLYIDMLNGQVRQAREQMEMYKAQCEVQATQTEEARKILKETAGEMDLITFEKKQLMIQWKTSLINLTRRDEAVSASAALLETAKTEISDMKAEMIGIKREIITAQGANESLVAVRDRLQKEDKTLEEQIAKILTERDALAERYQMLQRSMAQTDDEEKNVDSIKEELEKKLETVVQNVQVVNRERQKLELSRPNKENEKLTVAKAVKNYSKAMGDLKETQHAKEMEATNVENELSRIRVDALNTEAHNVQLREMVQKAVTDLNDKEKLIEKYQMEIRQRNDEIEKKMYKVDSLNRKYEKLVESHEAAGGGEGPLLGPLEGTIKALKKETASLGEESLQHQRDWLNDQTQLVNVTAETEDLLEKNSELRAKVSILNEKKLRTVKGAATQDADIKRLAKEMDMMHTDMSRLNDLIGKNTELSAELQNSNSVMEMDFVSELKELEEKSVAMETKLTAVKSTKAELLDEIMEAERQLLLWEKKIQLEKETQAALDPSVGQGEVHAMTKEIHRMKLRLVTLRGEKETLVKEIERAVHKRESLSLRFKGKEQVGAKVGKQAKAEFTRAGLSKKTAGLKKTVRQTAQSTAEYMAAIQDRKENISAMTTQLEEHTTNYGQLEEQANSFQVAINQQLYEKQRQAELQQKRHRMLKRYQALERGQRQPVSDSDQPMIDAKLTEAVGNLSDVKRVVSVLGSKFEHLQDVLGRVMELAADE
jgi:chromosome segregation ATPase